MTSKAQSHKAFTDTKLNADKMLSLCLNNNCFTLKQKSYAKDMDFLWAL